MFIRSLTGVRIIEQNRTINTVYNKRIWDGDDSEPYKSFDDWYETKYGVKHKQ